MPNESADRDEGAGPASTPPIPPAEIAGSTIRLREATLADAEIVDGRAGDPEMIGEFNDFGLPKPRRLAENLADGKRMVSAERGQLLIERLSDGAIIGEIGWHPVMYGPTEGSRALNIGLSLIPEARGHGHGTEAQRLIAELLFRLFDVERIEASTDVQNIAEQRSLEKAGYMREGIARRAQERAGAQHDLVMYSIVRSDLGVARRSRASAGGRAPRDRRRSRPAASRGSRAERDRDQRRRKECQPGDQ